MKNENIHTVLQGGSASTTSGVGIWSIEKSRSSCLPVLLKVHRMEHVPAEFHCLLASEREKEAYETAARAGNTDIRIWMAVKFRVLENTKEGSCLTEPYLELLAKVTASGAKKRLNPMELRRNWLQRLRSAHGNQRGAIAQYLDVHDTQPHPRTKEPISKRDLYAHGWRREGHWNV